MRLAALLFSPAPLALPVLLAAAACSDEPAAIGEKIQLETPSFTLQPGEEKFYCYYTTLANAEATGIYKMSSSMPPGSHHMIVFKTRTEKMPAGTFAECENFGMGEMMGGGGFDLADLPVWLYASQDPEFSTTMPEDVGIAISPNQPVIINMHYINVSDAPLTANVKIDLEPYVVGYEFTPAHAFISFNTQIDVPAGTRGSAGGSCDVPVGSKFIMMSTHSHKYTTSARVRDGEAVVLETLDWAHATVERWSEPYYTFQTSKIDYRCEYNNTTNEPLKTGESALTDEMCMAVGVYFPSRGDTYCLNSFSITL
jgi:hypothetical protein